MCVSTGSENNSLYLYYKGLSKTLLTFKFDTVKSVLDKDKKEDDTNEFVSAVCWRALPDGVSHLRIVPLNVGACCCQSSPRLTSQCCPSFLFMMFCFSGVQCADCCKQSRNNQGLCLPKFFM